MINQQQLNETPLNYALNNYNSRKNSNRPKPYLQVNQFGNSINPTEEDVPIDANTLNAAIIGSPYRNQLTPTQPFITPFTPNQTLQTVIPFQTDQGTVYYGDTEEQTCSNLRTFMKDPGQKHCCVLIFNLVLYIVGIVGIMMVIVMKLPVWFLAQFVGFPFLLYFFFGLCSHSLGTSYNSLRPYSEFEGIYQQLRQRTSHIYLRAQCYHFTGGKRRRKVVTHTASHMIPVRECADVSDDLTQIKENNSYIFLNVKKYFCFADQVSHKTFIDTFTVFKNSNMQDLHRRYLHCLDIALPNMTTEIGLAVNGTGGCIKPMYVLFLLLGMGYFYLLYVEWRSQRYSINIIKRISL